MNILMVTNTYIPIVGGVERSITSFTDEFRKLGHKVLIITLEFDGMPEDEKDVVRIPAIRHFNGSDFSIRLPIPTNLAEILKQFQPDIVHSHHPFILGDTALRIANEYRIPIVFTHHTKYEDYTHYVPLDSPLMKKFVVELTTGYADLVDHVIAPSESVRTLLLKRKVSTPVDVVPTGVDFKKFSKGSAKTFRKKFNIDKNDFIVGHVGRLAPEKNLSFLVGAVASFVKRNARAKFLLIGKGPSAQEIKNTFDKEDMSDRLIVPGVLSGQDLINAYHAMDVFAFSSKTETQGMVLLEAMAASVPVVALDASGVKDVLKDNENGILVHREDADEFSGALEQIYHQDKERKKAFRKKAKETAAAISIDKTALRLIDIYSRLLEKDFVYYDIENSPWGKVLGRLKAEWELTTNLTDAVGSTIKEQFSNDPKEGWLQKTRRWLNNNEWSARIAGLSQSQGTTASPGLVLVQIDGLALTQIKKAIKNGKMPFLQKLISKERHTLCPFYSGQPSSTPAVQAELFYGVKGAVPSFSFLDRETGEVFKMYDQRAAVEIEKRLSQEHPGLLEGGSSYSNIYSGGAEETHFCAVDLGWGRLWEKIRPVKVFLLGMIHILSIIKTVLKLGIETISSLLDFMNGLLRGEDFIKELKFIPTRLAISILLRDLMTFGAKIDIIRGLPVIHMNFTGYDEHAHRRGPSSKFAHWTLWGIDRCIAKIYQETFRSQRRNYDVWIYSDHGQEDTLSYAKENKMFVHQKIQEIFHDLQLQDDYSVQIEERGVQSHRAHYLGSRLFRKISPLAARESNIPPQDKLVVTAMGPAGHIYVPNPLDDDQKDLFARRLVKEAGIPLVLSLCEGEIVHAWNERGKFCLPEEAVIVFGADHPFLKEVTVDMIRTCSHPNAGTFTISGWQSVGRTWSFPVESGSHGGPGKEETKGFALLPGDVISSSGKQNPIRSSDLRDMALKFMKKQYDGDETRELFPARGEDRTVRIMTYNVHGCRGMDSKISPGRIARVIARYKPDIVALQELDMNRKRSGGIDQPHIIARELEMHYHFHPTVEVAEQQYGNAILSKFPIEVVSAKALPGVDGRNNLETRGAIWSSIRVGSVMLQVLNVHLGLFRKERLNQIEALLGDEWLSRKDCNNPIIFMGDFNALPNSTVCKRVKTQFRDIQEALHGHRARATWAGHFPFRRIDHVFISPGIEVKNIEVGSTRLDRIASDHLPLIVDVRIADKIK